MGILIAIFSGFAAALLAPMLCRRIGKATGPLLAILPLALCVYFGAAALGGAGLPVRFVQPWAPGLGVQLSFQLDGLSALFSLMITGIGGLVLIYAGGYLSHDPADERRRTGCFYAFVLCFMSSMLGLVLADNVLALYLFWEGTSITSFLLIGINHERPTARAAAWQALLVTGGGGLALLAGLLMLGQAAGTYELSEMILRGDAILASGLYLPALLLVLLGAFTKSAQFPFHFWLPSAMEAPTPVSAYLHSATMVKAGVYLLARLSPALAGTAVWSWTTISAGAVTALLGGYLATHTSDLKRVLAYSTVSVLGTLVLLLGVGTEGAVKGAVVLLLAHAMYKGALFMIVGAIDHETGTRELDRLGGLWRFMPITATAAVLAAVSMAGLWPMLNFIAKELLLEAVWTWGSAGRIGLAMVAVLAGAMFFVVAWIVGVRPFFGEFPHSVEKQHVHEPPFSLWIGPALLAAGGLVFGLFPRLIDDLASPAASAVLARSVEVHLALWHGVGPALLLSGASIALGAGLYFGWVRYRRTNPLLERVLGWGPNRWYRDIVSGLNAVAVAQTRLLQSGNLRYYLLTTMGAVVLMVAVPLVWRVDLFRVPSTSVGFRFYEVALAVLIVLAAFAAVRAQSRVAGIAALGVVGYAVGLIFVLFGAPDLAMTQFLVETLIVILFVLVFNVLPPPRPRQSTLPQRMRDAGLALAGGAVVTALALMANNVTLDARLSTFFIENSLPGGHGRNIVNVILVDFRGLDTLGEITVLAVAGMGIYALLKLRPAQARPRQPGEPDSAARHRQQIADDAAEVELELAGTDSSESPGTAEPAGGTHA